MAEKSRRKLIKGLGISIPTAWAAPIIEAVLLPAHAQTSRGTSLDECESLGWVLGDPSGTGLSEAQLGDTNTCEECMSQVMDFASSQNDSKWDVYGEVAAFRSGGYTTYAATWSYTGDGGCYAEGLNGVNPTCGEASSSDYIYKCLPS